MLKDPYLSLLEHRNTPVDGFKSPSQLLMSRRLRSILPMAGEQLEPQVVDQKLVNAKWKLKQAKQRQSHDRTAQPLSAMVDGCPHCIATCGDTLVIPYPHP